MQKYLWIGMCVSEEEKQYISENGGKLLSAYVSQTNIFDGLENISDFVFDSINAVRLPEYPKFKDKFVKRFTWEHKEFSKDVSVGYKNNKYFSHIHKKNALVKEAKIWAKENKNSKITVFVYSMHSPFMAAAEAIKKINPKTKIVLIVPDLPQFMDMNMSFVKKVLKDIDFSRIKHYMKSVDKYILYTKHMADMLGLKEGSWTVVEGSIDVKDEIDTKRNESDTVSVMYSGVLDTKYGIPELLSAFSKIKEKNYELWFTGTGNAVSLIDDYAKKDERIKNYGFLPSRKDLLIKQSQATMLINVRKPSEKASAYCFPSKIFEYMLSGRPVLSFRITGIPDEYFDYLIEIPDETETDIAKTIKKIALMPEKERYDIGQKAKAFVLNNKNVNSAAEKILSFVKDM